MKANFESQLRFDVYPLILCYNILIWGHPKAMHAPIYNHIEWKCGHQPLNYIYRERECKAILF